MNCSVVAILFAGVSGAPCIVRAMLGGGNRTLIGRKMRAAGEQLKPSLSMKVHHQK